MKSDDDMRLKDKVAVVTGGGNGIGRSICMAFADEGANVVIADIDAAAAKAVADEIVKHGGRAIALIMDVTNSVDVNKGVKKTMEAFGRLHILINNAGIEGHRANIREADERDWRRIIED